MPDQQKWQCKKILPWYLLVVVIIVADQLTKMWADTQLLYGQPVEVTPFFNLTLLYNQGAAFSFLSDAGGWQRWLFTGISIAVSLLLVIWIARLNGRDRLLAAALALILGGAVGNLLDRVLLGHVIDFISLHYQGSYFPAFNIADSAISVGAVLMLWDAFFVKHSSGEVK